MTNLQLTVHLITSIAPETLRWLLLGIILYNVYMLADRGQQKLPVGAES